MRSCLRSHGHPRHDPLDAPPPRSPKPKAPTSLLTFKTGTEKIQTLSITLQDKLPFEDNLFDFITMLAVMEHSENDQAILKECARLMQPGGGLIITVPSWYAKPVLEFLSYKLNLINPAEIRDHKRYYNRDDLFKLVGVVGNLAVQEHAYFQWQFNDKIYLRAS